jgi:hypothetical protein
MFVVTAMASLHGGVSNIPLLLVLYRVAHQQQAYKMYKLFHGSFTHILERNSREALLHKLELFFPYSARRGFFIR